MLTIASVTNGLPHQIIFTSWLRNREKAQDLSLVSLSGISLTCLGSDGDCCLGNFLCSVRYLKKLDKGFVLMYEMLKWFFFSESWSMFESYFEHCSTGYSNMFGKCYLCIVAILSICCFHFLLSSYIWQYLIDRKNSECESAILKLFHQESCGLNPC